MRTNTGCALYNLYRNETAGVIEIKRTYLETVFWEPRKAVNVIRSGSTEADAVLVYVPLYCLAGGKTFLPSAEYASLAPADVGNYWTLTAGKDYLVKGDTPSVGNEKELKALLASSSDSFKISSVDAKFYGSKRLQHWEVSGK